MARRVGLHGEISLAVGVLTVFGEVLDEVVLRAELADELLGHHSPLLCAF
jgi:hypothetical protein